MKKLPQNPILNENSMGTKAAGLLGAFYGATIFGVPMLLSLIFIPKLYIFASLSVLIGIGSCKLYKGFRGYRLKRWATISVVIITLLTVFLMTIVGQSLYLSRIDSWKESAAQYGIKVFDLALASVLSGENFRYILPAIVICQLISLLGIVFCYEKFTQYASCNQEDEKKAAVEDEKKAQERIEAAKSSAMEKHKNKPHSLNSFMGKKEEPISFTAAPAPKQKKYLQIMGLFLMVLFIALAVFCIYKAFISKTYAKLLYSILLFFLSYQALKLIRYGRRSIKFENKTLCYTPSFGDAFSFNLSEIDYGEKDHNIIALRKKDGSFLASFALTWDNGKKLQKTLENNNIMIISKEKE